MDANETLFFHVGTSDWIILQFIWFLLNEANDWMVEKRTDGAMFNIC